MGLTPGEIRALGHVIRFRGSRQAVLAERMGVEPMTLSAYLDRLEARKLIHRTMDPNDRRAKLIEPTEEAFRIMRELDPLFDKIFSFATQGLTEEQIRAAGAVLRIVRGNLSTDPQLEEPVNLLCKEPRAEGSNTA
ncbi:MarR family winged helix-turn-helix transcriptional regulator [Aureimonas flava]|uniref:MarR family winged helix-turn-helix transcriptional regulator n=1 Tax=Aureimonas flava TaxID=2320271 RepID=UPI001FDEA593|nr:MarR family winged helix-turn-helix transcriptional regulator [Aureimonas flava]